MFKAEKMKKEWEQKYSNVPLFFFAHLPVEKVVPDWSGWALGGGVATEVLKLLKQPEEGKELDMESPLIANVTTFRDDKSTRYLVNSLG